MGCATGIVRIIMFLFNLVFALAGLALLIVGILFKLNVNEVTQVVPDGLEVAPILLIVVGSVVFVIAFFGCCGAVRESTCMLTTYAVILLVIFLLQVAIAVYAFLKIKDTTDLQTEFRSGLQKAYDRYETDSVARETIDVLQTRLECCGLDREFVLNNGSRPFSCCATIENNTCATPFTLRCFQPFYDYIINIIRIIGIVAISIAAVEILGAIAALCLSSSIKNQYRRGAYA